MKRALFLPTARQTNWLLVIGFLSLGQALYLRYMTLENNTVSLACQSGLRTWLCDTFRLTIVLFNRPELRLVLGPLASAGAAAKLCSTLERFRLTCQPTIFAGRHLALD